MTFLNSSFETSISLFLLKTSYISSKVIKPFLSLSKNSNDNFKLFSSIKIFLSIAALRNSSYSIFPFLSVSIILNISSK